MGGKRMGGVGMGGKGMGARGMKISGARDFITALTATALIFVSTSTVGFAAGRDSAEASQTPVYSADASGEASETFMDLFGKSRETYKSKKGSANLTDGAAGERLLRVVGADGSEAEFVIDENTAIADAGAIAKNDDATVRELFGKERPVFAYYVEPEVMTAQYPPRYRAVVIMTGVGDMPPAGGVGAFDKDGLSLDGSLRLTIDDDVKITSQEGGEWKRGFGNQTLVAYYDVVLESYPGQARPTSIIVLDKIGVPVAAGGGSLTDAYAFTDEKGVTFVPLRAVCESNDAEVFWDGATLGVRIGRAVSLTIGKNEYLVGRMAPIALEAAPILLKGRTYVPASFFTQVLHYESGDTKKLDFTL